MQAIFNRAMSFQGPGGMKVVVHPAPGPQVVPDWVKDTEAFELGLSDDSIIDTARPKPVEKKVGPTPITSTLPKISAEHVAFLDNPNVRSIADATTFIGKMSEAQQVKFFTDFDEAAAKKKADADKKAAAAAK
jgi:hypothetical protein